MREQLVLRMSSFRDGRTLAGVLFAVYVFSTAFDFVAIVPGVSIGRMTSFCMLVFFALNARTLSIPKRLYVAFAFAFLFSSLLVILLMPNPADGVSGFLSYVLNIAVFFGAVFSRLSEKDVRLCENALVLSAVCLSLLMFTNAGFVGDEWVTDRLVVNIAGSQQDPNQFCGYFLFAVAFCTYKAIKEKRPGFLCVVCLCFYSILLTGSRGGLIANGAACVIAAAFGIRGSKHRLLIVLLIIFILFAVALNYELILSWLPTSVASRYANLSFSAGTASYRTRAWSDIIVAFVDSDLLHQVFGNGYASTTQVTFNNLVAHNTYLEILYSFGIIGFVSYCGLLTNCLNMAHSKRDFTLVAALVGFFVLICSITDTSSKTMWALLALAAIGTDQANCRKVPDQSISKSLS